MNILIVDDEKDLVEFLKNRLVLKGHSVDVAYDGKDALEKAKSDRYDIVFSDHNMPEMTGVELIRHMKNNKLKAKIAVITGYQESDEYFMKTVGADEYLTKPVQMQDVENIIAKYSVKPR